MLRADAQAGQRVGEAIDPLRKLGIGVAAVIVVNGDLLGAPGTRLRSIKSTAALYGRGKASVGASIAWSSESVVRTMFVSEAIGAWLCRAAFA